MTAFPDFPVLFRRLFINTLVFMALLIAMTPAPASAFGSSGSSFFGSGNSDFLPVDEALPFSHRTEDNGAVVLSWDIAPEHYLYKSRIQVSAVTEGVTLGDPEFSLPGTLTEDEFFGEMMVFFEPVEARVAVNLPDGVREAELQVSYQGCANAGLCYPPQTQNVLYYPGQGQGQSASPPATESGNTSASTPASSTNTSTATGLAGFLSSQSIWMIAGLFFLLGLGLTFTPCVLPMVPIISTMVSGHNTRSTGHALLLSGSYVLGMALTYAAAGVLTGLLGASFNLQAQLQSPWVLGVFATLFVLFALSMFDLFEIQLPRFIRESLNDASQKLTGTRVVSIFGIGSLSALIVSPCVSAPLAGSLLYISTTQDAVIGGVALLALGLGMGVPLMLVAVGGRKLLPTSGHWMTTVKHFYGVMLLAVAIWLLERIIPVWVALTLWGLLIAIAGVQLGAFDVAKAGWQRTRKGLGLVMFAYGLALLAGAVSGANDPLRPLAPFIASASSTQGGAPAHADFQKVKDPEQIRAMLAQAKASQQPVMLDFYADWCISCKIMERNVFSDQDVIQALGPYTLLQIDMTDNTPAQQALLNDLGLFGPPAILFYRDNGAELKEARVLGEMNRRQFLDHLGKVAQES
ncbi:thiol:disulfide interchange protein DsbD 1 [Marinobacter halophilus]|uniref:Thiol:disulfide interchange protein DsbD n=2 Tax=Marinobacter halophilus TaxID=1323740 RepID=A0A2T1K904_9GAMM|nr:protein-disulfide reductase DsbD [Marinobacter halophilus]PSF06597.1 thiol:disulfide interchange protein [Marinobacter halophilus]GGC73973.1 thiol:disulfide interchange protein DsbD 1 [Marinobacter halophilus]